VRIPALLLILPLALPAAEKPLILNELVEEVLRSSPTVRAARKRYEAARQRPAQEGSLPDPMISAGWNASGNPLPGAGLGREPVANIGVMASQELPAPGKLRLRAQVAAREADAEAQAYRSAQLGVVSQLQQAYFRLQHDWASQKVLSHGCNLLRQLLKVTEVRYTVGKATQADVFKAQTQITLTETRMIQLEGERRARKAEINSLLGRPPESPLADPEDPVRAALPFTVNDLLARAAAAAPMLARDQKMIERATAAVSLARTGYLPDVTLNAGYYTMGAMPSMYMFRADVRLPLQRGRIRAEVAERSYQAAEARHNYEAGARSLEYRVREEFLMAETAARLLDLYQKVALPQARLTVESSLTAYQAGTGDFLSVLMNQMAVIDTEMNLHDQMQAFHLALARMEEMTGVELVR